MEAETTPRRRRSSTAGKGTCRRGVGRCVAGPEADAGVAGELLALDLDGVEHVGLQRDGPKRLAAPVLEAVCGTPPPPRESALARAPRIGFR